MKNKIIKFMLVEAAIGNIDKVNNLYISKKLDIELVSVNKAYSNLSDILDSYSNILDKKTLVSIEEEDMQGLTKREILLEFLMARLDIMKKDQLAISNILNFSLKKPNLLLRGLMQSKVSMEKIITKLNYKSIIKKKITLKFLVLLWPIILNKWLHADNDEEIYALLDKELRRLEKIIGIITKKS